LSENTLGIETWSGGNRRTRGKASKLDIITQISLETKTKSLDIGNLNLGDLTKILKVACKHETLQVVMPTGRLKSPYVDTLQGILPTVKNLDKLSILSLQALLGAFINE